MVHNIRKREDHPTLSMLVSYFWLSKYDLIQWTTVHAYLNYVSTVLINMSVHCILNDRVTVRVMVFITTFNNISVISWWSVFLLYPQSTRVGDI